MHKKLCCLSLALLTTPAFCAYPGSETANLSYTIGYESYKLPAGLDNLGLINLGILYHPNSMFYTGMQLDSAVRGNSGGYYALGLNNGLQYPLLGPLLGRVGVIVGGGGGHDISQTVGGGFFYQPYLGLDYKFDKAAFGLQYSYIRFPGGKLASSQLGLQISAPLDFSYADFALRNQALNDYAITSSSSLYFSLLDSEIFPKKSMHNTRDQLMDSRFNMVGFEMGQYASQNIYYFLKVLGEVHGISNGFAGLLGGIGYQLPIFYNTEVFTEMAAGSAGGGAVDTRGGFVYMPTIGLRYHVTSDFAVSASASLFNSTKGDFKSQVLTMGLRYSFKNITNVHVEPLSQLSYQGWQIRLFNQTYLRPKSDVQQTLPTMQLFGAQVNFYAKPYLYLAGQTAFAYHGENSGGYFTGLFGPGLSTSIADSDRFSAYAQTLLGAAGGGGLDIHDGAMIQPEVGLQYQLTHQLGLQAGVGQLIALKGKFDSTVLSFGINSSFSTLVG